MISGSRTGTARAPRPRWPLRNLALAATLLSACGAQGAPTGVATDPPYSPGSAGTQQGGTPSSDASGTRTVLTPLGLNVRDGPVRTANRLAMAARNTVFQVLGRDEGNGGWYHVHGETLTGWVSADPALTSPHRFQLYTSDTRGFDALYRDNWTFNERADSVVFRPQSGTERITVRGAAGLSALGPPGGPGYTRRQDDSVVVCGVTANLVQFDHATSSGSPAASRSAAPSSGGADQPLGRLAELQLSLDANHALDVRFDFDKQSQASEFDDFYNSMSLSAPQCLGPPAAPLPAPA
ncbi:MAG: hypothetical protein NVSMB29_13170 [Candidatus Dormibacteria bacterium]